MVLYVLVFCSYEIQCESNTTNRRRRQELSRMKVHKVHTETIQGNSRPFRHQNRAH